MIDNTMVKGKTRKGQEIIYKTMTVTRLENTTLNTEY